MRTLVLACFAAIGCYNPSFTECTITCGGMDNQTCPSGFNCDNGYCRSSSGSCAGSGDGDGGMILTDADLTQWSYRKPVTVSALNLPGALTNFPVLVRLFSDNDLAAHAQANGADILFLMPGTGGQPVKLKHEIEAFEASSGALVAWVTVPQLPQNAQLTFYMHYGNATASPQMEAAATCDSSYAAVWHLNDSSTAVTDSTMAMRQGTKPTTTTLTPIDALMGTGFNAGGTVNDRFDILRTGLPVATFTFEAWLNLLASGTGGGRLISTPMSFTPRYGVEYGGLSYGGGSATITVDPTIMTGSKYARSFQLDQGAWHHLMITWSSDAPEIYLDGNTSSSIAPVSNLPRADVPAMTFGGALGIDAPGPYGIVDEIRLSTSTRSAAYAKASYEIGRPNSPAVDVGSAESLQ